jgi:hypothetical protein
MAKLKIVNSKVFIAGVDVSDYVTAVEPVYQGAGLVEVKVTFVDDPRIETLDSGQKVFHVVEAPAAPALIEVGARVRVKEGTEESLEDAAAPGRLTGSLGRVVRLSEGGALATVSFDDEYYGWSDDTTNARPNSCWGVPLVTLVRA